MSSAPIVLVPGFWLGAWAWDEVAAVLRADDHDVTAVTLPGLESADADRSAITLSDHVDAICEAYTSDQYKAAVKEGYWCLDGLAELGNATWVDLPRSHWPMWSRPRELA